MTQTLLAKDHFADAIQALQLGASQNVTTNTSTSTQSTVFAGGTVVIRVVATTACNIATGTNPTATASSAYLAANAVEYFRVTEAASWRIAALATTTAGVLNVVEMA